MTGLLIAAVFYSYVLLTKYIVNKVYKKYKTKKAKYTALIIMILIPTWDIVLGYPIYKYLCMTKAGVHIYKTVDNVKGFYIGEKSKDYEPYEPPSGYKYVDYKEKESGKYYRSYWVDNNTSKDCVPYGKYKYSDYAKAFRHGKCIVKKEISEGEVTGLWKISKKELHNYHILYLTITSVYVEVIDPRTGKKYFTAKDYMVDKSWITGILNPINDNKKRYVCNGIAYNVGNTISHYTIESYIFKNKNKGEK